MDGAATVANVQNSVTVRELCGAVEQTFSAIFIDEVWVRGRISGLNRSNAGHVYFDLIDSDESGRQPSAVLPVALFMNSKQQVNAIIKKSGNTMRMEDGIEIQIRGRVTYYPKQSRVQLVMSSIDPSFTIGQLETSRAAVLASLAADDLIGANRQIALSVLPLRVGVITSKGSAAEADFVNELHLSSLPFSVTVIDARVQGEESVASLLRALAESEGMELDAVAIVRGGGARTDLISFDDESVARAIAACSRPVITGIGHEIDRSICDEVAHSAAKTPTACAGVLISRVEDFALRVDAASRRVSQTATQSLNTVDQTLAASRHKIGRLASGAVQERSLQIELANGSIRRAVNRSIEQEAELLERVELQVRSLDPAVMMRRGWSVTHNDQGALVRSASDVLPGEAITTTFADGDVRSTVEAND